MKYYLIAFLLILLNSSVLANNLTPEKNNLTISSILPSTVQKSNSKNDLNSIVSVASSIITAVFLANENQIFNSEWSITEKQYENFKSALKEKELELMKIKSSECTQLIGKINKVISKHNKGVIINAISSRLLKHHQKNLNEILYSRHILYEIYTKKYIVNSLYGRQDIANIFGLKTIGEILSNKDYLKKFISLMLQNENITKSCTDRTL